MNSLSFSPTMDSTIPLISEFPSFVLVCPSNCGWGSFTEITAARPSFRSSPLIFTSLSFLPLFASA